MEPSAAWRMRAVREVGVEAGIHQPSSWGRPEVSTPKWTSVKGRFKNVGVVSTVWDGCRTSCHWLREKRMQRVR